MKNKNENERINGEIEERLRASTEAVNQNNNVISYVDQSAMASGGITNA